MIRDEFIKQKNEKNMTAKQMAKIRKLGERSYFTSELTRLTNLKKTFNLSFAIIGVLVLIVTAIMLIAWISSGVFVMSMITPIVILSVMWILQISWFFIIRPSINDKIIKYGAELEQIRRNDIEKQRKIYEKMKK